MDAAYKKVLNRLTDINIERENDVITVERRYTCTWVVSTLTEANNTVLVDTKVGASNMCWIITIVGGLFLIPLASAILYHLFKRGERAKKLKTAILGALA